MSEPIQIQGKRHAGLTETQVESWNNAVEAWQSLMDTTRDWKTRSNLRGGQEDFLRIAAGETVYNAVDRSGLGFI